MTKAMFQQCCRLIAAIVVSSAMIVLDRPIASAVSKQQDSGSEWASCNLTPSGSYLCIDKDGVYSCPSNDSKKEECTKAARTPGGAQAPSDRPKPAPGVQMK